LRLAASCGSVASLAAVASLAGLIALAALPAPVEAQAYGRAVSVHGSLALGGYWSDESFNGNGLSFGGALDFFPTSVLGFELAVDGGTHSRDFESGVRIEGSTTYFSGNVLLRFSRYRVQPYLVGGVGLLHSSTDRIDPSGERFDLPGEPDEDTAMGNVGVGFFLFTSSRVSVRPEFRVVAYDDSSPVTFYYRASVALGYHF
jgi:opacity protein-like surface antigen